MLSKISSWEVVLETLDDAEHLERLKKELKNLDLKRETLRVSLQKFEQNQTRYFNRRFGIFRKVIKINPNNKKIRILFGKKTTEIESKFENKKAFMRSEFNSIKKRIKSLNKEIRKVKAIIKAVDPGRPDLLNEFKAACNSRDYKIQTTKTNVSKQQTTYVTTVKIKNYCSIQSSGVTSEESVCNALAKAIEFLQKPRYWRKKQRRKQYIFDYKEGKSCADCGLKYGQKLTFDHLPQFEKKCNVGDASTMNLLKKEIAKCELVCITCHETREVLRGRHFTKKKTPKHIQQNIKMHLRD